MDEDMTPLREKVLMALFKNDPHWRFTPRPAITNPAVLEGRYERQTDALLEIIQREKAATWQQGINDLGASLLNPTDPETGMRPGPVNPYL